MASANPGLPLERVTGLAGRSVLRRPVLARVTKHEQRDATVLGEVRLRYVDVRPAAESGPPVVLLHGIASRIEEYEALIDPARAPARGL